MKFSSFLDVEVPQYGISSKMAEAFDDLYEGRPMGSGGAAMKQRPQTVEPTTNGGWRAKNKEGELRWFGSDQEEEAKHFAGILHQGETDKEDDTEQPPQEKSPDASPEPIDDDPTLHKLFAQDANTLTPEDVLVLHNAQKQRLHDRIAYDKEQHQKEKTTRKKEIDKLTANLEYLREHPKETVMFQGKKLDIRGVRQELSRKKNQRSGVAKGTLASTAGEAATVNALLQTKEILDKEHYNSVEEYNQAAEDYIGNTLAQQYMNIAKNGVGQIFFDKTWAKAAIAQAKGAMRSVGGLSNVEAIGWDTPEGHKIVGLQTEYNSKYKADMFFKMKNGRIVGISLKKDGNVFLTSAGLFG
jgi:hypothetical protein